MFKEQQPGFSAREKFVMGESYKVTLYKKKIEAYLSHRNKVEVELEEAHWNS